MSDNAAPVRPDYCFIWSNEHKAWWKPGSCGYTTDMTKAGLYTRENALTICRNAIPSSLYIGLPSEIPVRERDMFEFMSGEMIPAAFYGRRGP